MIPQWRHCSAHACSIFFFFFVRWTEKQVKYIIELGHVVYMRDVVLYQSTRWHVQCLLYCHKSHEKFMLFNDGPTTYYNLTLVDLQLDAQNSYLFTYNTFIKILYMFRALPCSSSGGLRCNCIYAASGIVTVCRWLSCAPGKKKFFLYRCTRVTIPEAAYIQLRRRPPEDEQGNARNT
jgi:hypothetical protein